MANSMSSLPLKLYKDNFNQVNNRIADLMANGPNPFMTSFEFIRMMEVHRDTYGNAFALKKFNDQYQVDGLYILDPNRVEPVLEKGSYDLYYEVDTGEKRYYVHNLDMIHVSHITTDGLKGISPIDVLRNSIDYDRKIREFSLSQMDSGLKASFILSMSTHLGEKEKLETLESFKNFYQDNGGVILLDSGSQLEEIKRDFIDLKVFEVEKVTRSRVAIVFNLPLHMLGESEGNRYSNPETSSIEFTQNTMLPIVRQYEQEFNRKLLTDAERGRGLHFKFNLNALLRADEKTRGEFYFKGIRSGWITPNEVRAYEEKPPLPGADKLFMSKDLSPIDDPERLGKEVNTGDGGRKEEETNRDPNTTDSWTGGQEEGG